VREGPPLHGRHRRLPRPDPGVGHFIKLEAPHACNRAVKAFLGKAARRPPRATKRPPSFRRCTARTPTANGVVAYWAQEELAGDLMRIFALPSACSRPGSTTRSSATSASARATFVPSHRANRCRASLDRPPNHRLREPHHPRGQRLDGAGAQAEVAVFIVATAASALHCSSRDSALFGRRREGNHPGSGPLGPQLGEAARGRRRTLGATGIAEANPGEVLPGLTFRSVPRTMSASRTVMRVEHRAASPMFPACPPT
jgi:hypothetical protein